VFLIYIHIQIQIAPAVGHLKPGINQSPGFNPGFEEQLGSARRMRGQLNALRPGVATQQGRLCPVLASRRCAQNCSNIYNRYPCE
jgi:hypothetical protein